MSKTIEDAAKEHAVKAYDTVLLRGEMESPYAEQARLSFIAGAQFALTHQWRSVEDELPLSEEDVMLRYENPLSGEESFAIGYRKDVQYFRSIDNHELTPTHFMPIPSLNLEKR